MDISLSFLLFIFLFAACMYLEYMYQLARNRSGSLKASHHLGLVVCDDWIVIVNLSMFQAVMLDCC